MTRFQLGLCILGVATIAAVVCSYTVYESAYARHRKTVQRCNALFNFGLRVRDAEAAMGTLPFSNTENPRAKGEYSWRINVLTQFDREVYGITNSALPGSLKKQSAIAWRFTADSDSQLQGSPDAEFFTIRGRDTVSDVLDCGLADLPQSLIIVIRVPRSGVQWFEPVDCDLDDLVATSGSRSLRQIAAQGPIIVLFADGAVWAIDESCPPVNLTRLMTVDGASKITREELLGPYRKMEYR